jgi:hypothetical protein
MNKKLVSERKASKDEVQRLKHLLSEQRRDNYYLRSTLKDRDRQLHSLSAKLEKVETANARTPRAEGSPAGGVSGGGDIEELDSHGKPLFPRKVSPKTSPSEGDSAATDSGGGGGGGGAIAYDRLNKLSTPVRKREKVVSDGIAKTETDWIQLRAMQSPGVGQYDTDKAFKKTNAVTGGKFNMSKPMSDVDWVSWCQSVSQSVSQSVRQPVSQPASQPVS